MLEMKKQCERCAKALEAHDDDACICSFECTFCLQCTTEVLNHCCPNCGGVLVIRPSRVKSD